MCSEVWIQDGMVTRNMQKSIEKQIKRIQK